MPAGVARPRRTAGRERRDPGKARLRPTLACRVPDLGAAFHARLVDGRLVDIADGDDPKAKIALTADSDDLIALVQGRLDVTRAVASRQVAIKANPFDLLKLRKLLYRRTSRDVRGRPRADGRRVPAGRPRSGMTAPVETRRLTKRYGTLTAVDALDLEVRPGRGLRLPRPERRRQDHHAADDPRPVRPTSGEVRLFGRAPGPAGHLSRVGSLVEGPAFYPYLSGRDNLRVLARHAGVPAGRIAVVLDQVELTGRAGDRYGPTPWA